MSQSLYYITYIFPIKNEMGLHSCLTFITGPVTPLCPGNFSGLMTAGLDGGIADAGLI